LNFSFALKKKDGTMFQREHKDAVALFIQQAHRHTADSVMYAVACCGLPNSKDEMLPRIDTDSWMQWC
jgi:hypothetical protein